MIGFLFTFYSAFFTTHVRGFDESKPFHLFLFTSLDVIKYNKNLFRLLENNSFNSILEKVIRRTRCPERRKNKNYESSEDNESQIGSKIHG